MASLLFCGRRVSTSAPKRLVSPSSSALLRPCTQPPSPLPLAFPLHLGFSMSSFFSSLPPPLVPNTPIATSTDHSSTKSSSHEQAQANPWNGEGDDRATFEALRSGMEGLFDKMEWEASIHSDAIKRLQQEVRLWKDSYFSLDKEKSQLQSQLTAFQQSGAADNLRQQQQSIARIDAPSSLAETQLPSAESSSSNRGAPASGGRPFTAIVIDGEALMLSETLLKQGKRGGLKAADVLFTGLREMAMAMAGQEADITCLGFLVVSRFELGEQLVSSGILPFTKVFDDFCLGLSDHHSNLFTVVDVPPGRAEVKVKEYVNFFASQDLCRMIILGSPNDGTYEPLLLSVNVNKLFIVNVRTETEGLDHALWPYENSIIVIPDAFSVEMTGKRLRDRRKLRAAQPSASSPSAPLPLPTPAQSPSTRLDALPLPMPIPRNPAPPPSNLKNLSVVDSDTWTVLRGKDKEKKVRKEEPSPAGGKRERGGTGRGGRGGGGRGGTEMDQAYLVVKSLDPRPCHMTYLSPDGCSLPDSCQFGHGYELSRTEISAVEKLAKEMLCPNHRYGKCKKDQESCIYSHECPRGDACTFGESCWFPEHNGNPLPTSKAEHHATNGSAKHRRQKEKR